MALTWTVAAINTAGAAFLLALATVLSKAWPRRYLHRRADHRRWMLAHRTGLRSRRALLQIR